MAGTHYVAVPPPNRYFFQPAALQGQDHCCLGLIARSAGTSPATLHSTLVRGLGLLAGTVLPSLSSKLTGPTLIGDPWLGRTMAPAPLVAKKRNYARASVRCLGFMPVLRYALPARPLWLRAGAAACPAWGDAASPRTGGTWSPWLTRRPSECIQGPTGTSLGRHHVCSSLLRPAEAQASPRPGLLRVSLPCRPLPRALLRSSRRGAPG